MSKGKLLFLLHAHLPFVRHPEHDRFLEENWLFEALSETYLPLLRMLGRVEKDNIPFKLSVSISPTLSAMLADQLLQDRYVRHLDMLLELSEKEIQRTKGDDDFHPLALMYKELFQQNYHDFTEKYEKNILKGFDYYYKTGKIDVITTAATHAYLPLYREYPEAIKAQIQTAIESHKRNFGKLPKGFWLPECGYYPGIQKILKSFGIKYFFTAAHGILFASERPRSGVFEPVECSGGIAAFGRDLSAANAVWSAEYGYPGDPVYREFYRDIGYDLPIDYISPYIHDGSVRINTGIKYFSITGDTDQKIPYKPELAKQKVLEHAEKFVRDRIEQIEKISPHMKNPPVIVCPYDAELFGHWWFEGPLWIEAVFREIVKNKQSIELVSGKDYLAVTDGYTKADPHYSSWGNKGYSEVWLDGSNDWIYRHSHSAIDRMMELVERYPDEQGLKQRALNQAAREVLLSQASDWPFIMRTGTTVPYAVKRVKEHLFNFNKIYDSLCRGNVKTEWLTTLEKKNNIFPDIDYRIFTNQSR